MNKNKLFSLLFFLPAVFFGTDILPEKMVHKKSSQERVEFHIKELKHSKEADQILATQLQDLYQSQQINEGDFHLILEAMNVSDHANSEMVSVLIENQEINRDLLIAAIFSSQKDLTNLDTFFGEDSIQLIKEVQSSPKKIKSKDASLIIAAREYIDIQKHPNMTVLEKENRLNDLKKLTLNNSHPIVVQVRELLSNIK